MLIQCRWIETRNRICDPLYAPRFINTTRTALPYHSLHLIVPGGGQGFGPCAGKLGAAMGQFQRLKCLQQLHLILTALQVSARMLSTLH